MVILREKRAQYAVHQTACQHFVVRQLALTALEASGDTSRRCEFLLIVNRQWQKVEAFLNILVSNNGSQQHGVTHSNYDRSVGLLR
ncbi:hypothetical protein D3C86_1867840 [compost metagenome]